MILPFLLSLSIAFAVPFEAEFYRFDAISNENPGRINHVGLGRKEYVEGSYLQLSRLETLRSIRP